MKPRNLTSYRLLPIILATSFLLALAACGERKVPITEQPTRKIDARLIGNWVSRDGTERIKIRQLNDSTYIISYFALLFRAFHSDIAGISFINVQELETAERNYIYMMYTLSSDGNKLYIRMVSEDVVPEVTKDSIAVRKLLRSNLQNPLLFRGQAEFTKAQ
ncbi:MAG: hypothetical protein ND866_22685 [Pyrinomonadaceae bacterium]|nr:hypothetical protein [Pyrinomonadaceae bacterium]